MKQYNWAKEDFRELLFAKYKNMDEIELGCLGLGEESTDYILCEGDIDMLPELYKQDDIRYEYNQGNQNWSRVSCTIFSAMGMVSDLMNYEFSLDELKEVDELSYSNGRIRGQGWYVKSAVDLVCKWWNEKHSDLGKVAYYRVSKYSNMIDKILEKGYTINGNCCPTAKYSEDYKTDAIVDGKDFGTNTNGHAIDIINDGKRRVKDSYKGRKTYDGKLDCNRYELKHMIVELSNFGAWFYVFTKVAEDNLEELKRLNEFKSAILVAIDQNSKLWHLTNDEGFRNKLHSMNEENRKKLKDIEIQLKRLS